MVTRKELLTSWQRYTAGLVVYGFGLFGYTNLGYYRGFISPDTLKTLMVLLTLYLVLGWPLLILTRKEIGHKPSIFLRALLKLVSGKTLDRQEKDVVLFFGVKFFYIPVMLNFLFANSRGAFDFITHFTVRGFPFHFRYDYTGLFSIIFAIDTLFFAFGYLVEHRRLNNMVKSVEPTLLGWAVALASYPPFNNITGRYLGWFSRDFFFYPDSVLDTGLKVYSLFLLLIYLWATISLGFRCSNLTNRGIVTGGAYKYIRHPAYASKVLFWWLTALPRFSVGAVLSLTAWTVLYYLRAVTEERHLGKDPDYRKYQKMTRFRFIPGLV